MGEDENGYGYLCKREIVSIGLCFLFKGVLVYDSDLCSEIAPRMRDYYVFFGGFVVKLRLDQSMISK